MKKYLIFFLAAVVWAQENVSSTIVLPDVKIVLEGDTSIPLQDQTNIGLSGQDIDFGRVDLAELAYLRKSEYYKAELTNQRKSPSFSLSSFRLWYGTSENLFSDITIGKRIDKLNYLVSYLRNSRGSLTLSNDRLYNTELKVDDIQVDVIAMLSPNWEFQTEVGYYIRELGLYTNRASLSEQVRYFPGKIGLSFIPDSYSAFTVSVEGNYFERQHKLTSASYTNQPLYHFSPAFRYEANWSKDNFLRLDGQYLYIFQDMIFHEGDVGFFDRLNVVSSFSLDVGARLYFSSRDPFFWYPIVMARYRYTDVLLFMVGIEGERKRFLGGNFVEENQYIFSNAVRADRWSPVVSVQYMPSEDLMLKGSVFYHSYSAYPNPVYQQGIDLFTYEELPNVSILAVEGGLEWKPVKKLLSRTTVSYMLPFTSSLYEVMPLVVSSLLEWQWDTIGLTTSVKGTYYTSVIVASGATLPDALIVNASFSELIGKDFYIEFMVNNLLNQNHFQRPSLPDGGIQLALGIRILL